MHLLPWRPFQSVDDFFGRNTPLFRSQMPKLFDDDGNGASQWAPSADISETKKEYLVKAELPDVGKSDIHVSVDDGALTIRGERKHHKEESDETYHRVESFYGTFSRAFALPDNIDASKITSNCKNGVLRVHLPKTKESKLEKATEIKVD